MSEHSVIEVDRRATCAAEAEALLRERDPVAAEALLRGLSIEDPSGRLSALLGDACFLQGRYEQAAAAYLEALQHVPGVSDWEAAAKRAWENALIGADVPIPPTEHFHEHVQAERIARGPRLSAPELGPDVPVSLSHEIAPIWREYERGTAAMLDGVKFGKDVIETDTVVMRSVTGTVRRVRAEHRQLDKFYLD